MMPPSASLYAGSIVTFPWDRSPLGSESAKALIGNTQKAASPQATSTLLTVNGLCICSSFSAVEIGIQDADLRDLVHRQRVFARRLSNGLRARAVVDAEGLSLVLGDV